MKKSRVHDIRREQKKSFYLRQIATFLQELSRDEPAVAQIFVTRVDLSADGGVCYVYCSTYKTQESYKQALEKLKLYKPSMRQALAKAMSSRYVPQIMFLYDEVEEKVRRVEDILTEISDEDDE